VERVTAAASDRLPVLLSPGPADGAGTFGGRAGAPVTYLVFGLLDILVFGLHAKGDVSFSFTPEFAKVSVPNLTLAAAATCYVCGAVTLALAAARLLDVLVASRAEHWSEELVEPELAAEACVLPDRPAVARALLGGGVAALGELSRSGLPRAVAMLERRMPACVAARPRQGVWLVEATARAHDPVAELATAPLGSRGARAWQLACELASDQRGVDAVIAAAGRDDATWLGTLNAWGRGRVDRDLETLADGVALRALAGLLADREPARAIAEARWHALLPRVRRDELLAAVARRAPTLRGILHA